MVERFTHQSPGFLWLLPLAAHHVEAEFELHVLPESGSYLLQRSQASMDIVLEELQPP